MDIFLRSSGDRVKKKGGCSVRSSMLSLFIAKDAAIPIQQAAMTSRRDSLRLIFQRLLHQAKIPASPTRTGMSNHPLQRMKSRSESVSTSSRNELCFGLRVMSSKSFASQLTAFINRSPFLADPKYALLAKSVSPMSTMFVVMSCPSVWRLGLPPISATASTVTATGSGPGASISMS